MTYRWNYLKKEVDLNYKKMSRKPKKIHTSALVRDKLDYIFFIEHVKQLYLILQIDEFVVNRYCTSSMAWVERSKSGYFVNDSTYESFSVISAITNDNLELVVIELGQHSKFFFEFINQLDARLHVKYKEEYKRFI